MKTILLLILFSYSFLENCEKNLVKITSRECHALTLDSNYSKCCYLYVEEDNFVTSVCYPITKEQLEAYDEMYAYIERTYPDADELKFDCNSHYINLVILTLISLLF
jgi:hypothetical protein